MFFPVPGLSRPLGTSDDLAGILLLATLLWSLSQRSHSYWKDTNQCENQKSRPENPPQRPSPVRRPNWNRLPKECWVGACVPLSWELGRKCLGGDNLALALLPREHTLRWMLPPDCIPVKSYTLTVRPGDGTEYCPAGCSISTANLQLGTARSGKRNKRCDPHCRDMDVR